MHLIRAVPSHHPTCFKPCPRITLLASNQVVPVTDADLRDDERQEAEQLAISAHHIEVTFTECLELLRCQRKVIDSGGIVRPCHFTLPTNAINECPQIYTNIYEYDMANSGGKCQQSERLGGAK